MKIVRESKGGVMHHRMTRRGLLALGATGMIASMGSRVVPEAGSLNDAGRAILRVLSNSTSAARIGLSALQQQPAMGQHRNVLRTLLRDLQLDIPSVSRMSTRELRKRLSRRVKRDFSTGRTIRVDGWLLSLSEMRVCMLAALNLQRTR